MEHPCLEDTGAVWVLCFLQGSFIPTRFQQAPQLPLRKFAGGTGQEGAVYNLGNRR